jgi:hypothetical protein
MVPKTAQETQSGKPEAILTITISQAKSSSPRYSIRAAAVAGEAMTAFPHSPAFACAFK